jgi:hypothetical protein
MLSVDVVSNEWGIHRKDAVNLFDTEGSSLEGLSDGQRLSVNAAHAFADWSLTVANSYIVVVGSIFELTVDEQ